MNLHWNILSKYRSELMGIAILWIMAFHMVELKHNKLPAAVADLYGLLFHGYLGVEIFCCSAVWACTILLRKMRGFEIFMSNDCTGYSCRMLSSDARFGAFTI